MKRFIALFLCLIMCLSLFPAGAFAEEENSVSKPVDIIQTSVSEAYEEPENESPEKAAAETRIISTEEELAELAELVNSGDEAAANGSYRLTDDLYLSGAFTPIGTAEHPFKGSFDGDGKKISGLSAAGGTGSFGLFGVTENARLKRIAIENAAVSADGYTAVGAIVGLMQGGTLTESYVTGAVSSSTAIVGGLVGMLDGGTVENCYNTAEVNGCDTVAAVSGGELRALKKGTAVITASCLGFEDTSFTVTVDNFPGGLLKIPAGTKRIEAEAFADCENIRLIEIPSVTESIGDNAFPDAVLLCREGSAGEEYAEKNGAEYILCN